jgi:hypothetical protein
VIIATKSTAAISQSVMGGTLPVLRNAITSEVYAIAGGQHSARLVRNKLETTVARRVFVAHTKMWPSGGMPESR